MDDIIVRSSGNITLLGGGKARSGDLAEALSLAPCLVAADGGAEIALRHGRQPDAVIGDMDSISDKVCAALPPESLHEIRDQDSTDFDKALRSVRAPLVLGIGFLGRRVDHQLANLNVLTRRSRQPCILIGKRDVVFAAPARLRLDIARGTRFSLFPMAPVRGKSRGLRWPIDGLQLSPGGVIGTSNRVKEDDGVELVFDGPGALVILPRSALRVAMAGLAAAGSDAPAK